jgi:hypothetical protein
MAMGVAIKIIAWTAAVAITAGVVFVFFAALREPVRIWRRGEHKRAILIGIGVVFGLLVWVGLSTVAP